MVTLVYLSVFMVGECKSLQSHGRCFLIFLSELEHLTYSIVNS